MGNEDEHLFIDSNAGGGGYKAISRIENSDPARVFFFWKSRYIFRRCQGCEWAREKDGDRRAFATNNLSALYCNVRLNNGKRIIADAI